MKTPIRLAALCVSAFVTVLMSQTVSADFGGANHGGGDSCEDRFKIVRQDLLNWIESGAAEVFTLAGRPQITKDEYIAGIKKQIKEAHIACVSPGDPGHPVLVNRKPKECKSEIDSATGIPQITCDREKFYSSLPDRENNPEQYRIVHHEYATLAGFEIPNADD